ncbi:hypothetical protein Tsubulata_001296 [Turnera subulata]|uniref:Uncharacterized protein n=1 Tax=Turnera subulata TaxID=218843 RepID=A0A9Q0FLH2_9ROSI|nr:hypothetical protein Tsubulata_001296 [Turnera subulata]
MPREPKVALEQLNVADTEGPTLTPVHVSASKPSWNRLAKKTPLQQQPSAEDWIKAHERGECYNDGMEVVVPLPKGDPREPLAPPAGYPLK